ncbi:MAG: alpha-L-fucosidase [Spirochaetota bacterium]
MAKGKIDDVHNEEVAAQHAQIGATAAMTDAAFKRNDHPDAQWFAEAGMGLFLHFGISSVRGEGDLSWSMMKRSTTAAETNAKYGIYAVQTNVSPAHYWEQANGFTADRFDPRKILTAAKNAGCSYAVLTTRHHDGFALWPSRFGELNIGRYQQGRDIVREYVDGCRAAGIKVGFYYSPPDWYFNRERMSFNYGGRAPDLDVHHRPGTLPVLSDEESAAYDERNAVYLRGQVEELLTNYGTIDVLWFDGSAACVMDRIGIAWIRSLQPGIVINPRQHGVGDFDTSECRFPDTRFPGWWEYCHVFSDGAWGYLNHNSYKPAGWALAELAKARSWGGNFLPNAAPDSHGEMPPEYYRRMEQIAKWMEYGAPSVFGVKPGPWPERSDVPVTICGNIWYLHIDMINDGAATVSGVTKPVSVKLLRTGGSLAFTFDDGKLSVVIPGDQRTTLDDVVAVQFWT